MKLLRMGHPTNKHIITVMRLLLLCVLVLGIQDTACARDPLFETGISLFEGRNYSGAKSLFNSLYRKDKKNPEVNFYLGKIAVVEGEYDVAVDHLKKAIKYNQNVSDYHLWYARAIGRLSQRSSGIKQVRLAKQTRGVFDIALELDPENHEARYDLIQYCVAAPGFLGGGMPKAYEQARILRQKDPMWGYLGWALVYQSEEKYLTAEKELTAGIERFPDEVRLQYALGCLYLAAKAYQKAFDVFNGIIKKYPEEIDVYYHIGTTCMLSESRLDKGIECLDNYICKETPESRIALARAHFILGQLHERKEDNKKAQEEYKKAMDLDPKFKEAKKALKRID